MNTTRRTTLEICIDSVSGARAAERGGADRIELCSNLLEGGTTPSTGMIRAVLSSTNLPAMVMVRPRGGHFCFSESEKAVMLREAEAVLEESVAGIVIGALTPEGEVDMGLCQKLRELAGQKSVTFHRALDQTADPFAALERLIDLGVDRVLTSGQAPSAVQGLERLARLVQHASGRLSVMPGCGIRASNVEQILGQTGAWEIHCSAARPVKRPNVYWRAGVPMSASSMPGDLHARVTQTEEVAAICQVLDR